MPKIQMRRDTAANWKSVNPTLLAGEWALETDTRLMKIGDGTTAYNALPYSTAEDSDEWQKPAEWIDIRSGALSNSVYFLVGHSADYTKYPKFGVWAYVSNGGTYDVYIDGMKYATTARNTATEIDWATLNLDSGFEVTYPEALRTHIVRVTPTLSTDTITMLMLNSAQVANFGLLWAHFVASAPINITKFARGDSPYNVTCPILEAVTSYDNKLDMTGGSLERAFGNCTNLIETPLFVGDVVTKYAFQNCSSIKKLKFKGLTGRNCTSAFVSCHSLQDIEFEECSLPMSTQLFAQCYKLKSIKNLLFYAISSTQEGTDGPTNILQQCSTLEPLVLNATGGTNMTRLTIGGNSNARVDGLKGLVVSEQAPFNHATAPQLDVRYTGLERPALVNLFKSMPTVSDGQVCNITGATGAADLTAEDLAIATDKGWTITR